MKEISLYIHIPFCQSKCYYCDFISYANCESDYQRYIDALVDEMSAYSNKLSEYSIKSVFIGGGTPTTLSSNMLKMILDNLNTMFNISDDAEISIEANPGTLSKEKILTIKDSIVNRVSMGLQSTDNKLLKKLGRIHTYDEFRRNYFDLRTAGIDNINIDMMFGLPNQSAEAWSTSLKEIIKLEPEHLSCYGLIIEEGTRFYKLYNDDLLELPSEEDERYMYHDTIDILNNNGYNHYEISNFAKEGYQCRHNIVYWRCKEYVGLGAAAHSYYNGYRYSNPTDINEYINKSNNIDKLKQNNTKVDIEAAYEEFMFLGLRMVEGINKKEFYNRFSLNIENIYADKLVMLKKKGLLHENQDNVRLTSKGLDVANTVFSEFLIEN